MWSARVVSSVNRMTLGLATPLFAQSPSILLAGPLPDRRKIHESAQTTRRTAMTSIHFRIVVLLYPDQIKIALRTGIFNNTTETARTQANRLSSGRRGVVPWGTSPSIRVDDVEIPVENRQVGQLAHFNTSHFAVETEAAGRSQRGPPHALRHRPARPLKD